MSEAETKAETPLLRLEGIVKTFPGVRALDGVDFELHAGEVHVLFGENGAGKSTIINIIAGTFGQDAGRYLFDGATLAQLTPVRARRLGIQPVFQEFSLVPELSVEQNLFLGREPARWGMLDRATMRRRADEVLSRLGFELDPACPVNRLSRARQQMVEIAKAMMVAEPGVQGSVPGGSATRVLILDEPTASLTDAEAENLFGLVDQLREQGVAIIYVSHRMREIARLADRVTVLRDGRHIATVRWQDTSEEQLIELMTGRKVGVLFPEIPATPGAVTLRTEGLTLEGDRVQGASIEARSGEIVGIAGLVGCGKSELIRAVYGLERITRGRVMQGDTVIVAPDPASSLRRGVCYFPSDRAREGLALSRPIRENASMAALDTPAYAQSGVLRLGEERRSISDILTRLRLRPPQIERAVGGLSGGNRQKVLLARGMTRPMEIFMFDEPTVGIDVGAKLEVYGLMRELVEAGKTVVLVSSELPEVMGLAHRIYVMHEGRVVAHLQRDEFSEAAILAHFFARSAQREAA